MNGIDYDFRYAANMTNNVIDFYATFEGAPPPAAGGAAPFDVENAELEAERQARYTELINAYKATLDPEEQTEILNQLQMNAYEDMYNIILYTQGTYNLYNTANISGFPDYARDYEEIVDFKFSEWQLVD